MGRWLFRPADLWAHRALFVWRAKTMILSAGPATLDTTRRETLSTLHCRGEDVDWPVSGD